MKEKRNKQKPIPHNIQDFLTEDQQLSLTMIERFGWHVEFIRRPLFQKPTVVVMSATGQVGILKENGEIDQTTKIDLRS